MNLETGILIYDDTDAGWRSCSIVADLPSFRGDPLNEDPPYTAHCAQSTCGDYGHFRVDDGDDSGDLVMLVMVISKIMEILLMVITMKKMGALDAASPIILSIKMVTIKL